jgi:hypothetical protein
MEVVVVTISPSCSFISIYFPAFGAFTRRPYDLSIPDHSCMYAYTIGLHPHSRYDQGGGSAGDQGTNIHYAGCTDTDRSNHDACTDTDHSVQRCCSGSRVPVHVPSSFFLRF